MRLRLWLPPLAELRPDSPIGFEVIDSGRRVRARGEAVAAALPPDTNCELVLDALDVLLLDVRLPKLSATRLQKALPALVEERILGEVERNHMVATERDADGHAVVAVVDRAQLARALEMLGRAGKRILHVVPQPLALNVTTGSWRVRRRDGRAAVRTGRYSGTGFASGDEPPLELRLLLAQSRRRPAAIEVEGPCDTQSWSAMLGVGVESVTADDLAAPVALDLLQYGFSPSIVSWRSWLRPIVLGITLVLVALGGLNLHAWKLRAQEVALRETMARSLKESFPQVSAILDPLAQMRRQTADLRTGAGTERAGFLLMLTALARVVDADSVQSIEYRDGRGTVRLLPQLTDTEAERAQLSERAASAGLELRFTGDTATLTRGGGP